MNQATYETWRERVNDLLSLGGGSDNALAGLNIWLGCSEVEPPVKETGDTLRRLYQDLGATVLSSDADCCRIETAAVEDRLNAANALLMLAATPGVSAEALEFCHVRSEAIILEKMRVYMPEDYIRGYVYQRLQQHNARVTTYSPADMSNGKLCAMTVNDALTIGRIEKQREEARKREFRPHIGIITALPVEYAAVDQILGNDRRVDPIRSGSYREYIHGKISAHGGGTHRVAVTRVGKGNNKAAALAMQMLADYPTITDLLMVGVAAGIPDLKNGSNDVRLGDIVISSEEGVIQTDMKKTTSEGDESTAPKRPPSAAWHARAENHLSMRQSPEPYWIYLDEILSANRAKRPQKDWLADEPDPAARKPVRRPKNSDRVRSRPYLHLGPIGSANTVLKSAADRERLREEFKLKAVEMEGSGVAEAAWQHTKGYLVIRGICDYANDDKKKEWQPYAAAAAAAFARQLIESMPLEEQAE